MYLHIFTCSNGTQARTGEDSGAANFARRSPWPMINILRTPQVRAAQKALPLARSLTSPTPSPQVRAAQKGVPTGVVYKQNEERLSAVGTRVLEEMLYTRDWAALPAHAAHAKTARALQETADAATAAAPVPPPTAAAAGVCPFPHEQFAAATAATASASTASATAARPSMGANAGADADAAQAALEAAKRRALLEMQQRQEEVLRRQQELGLVPSAEAGRRQPTVAAGAHPAGAGEEEEVEEVVDVFEGISAALVSPPDALAASAAASVAVPAAVPVAAAPAASASTGLALSEVAEAEAFLAALDREAAASGARLAALIARTDEGASPAAAGGEGGEGAWETDYLLLAEEAERWLAQEEEARAAQR